MSLETDANERSHEDRARGKKLDETESDWQNRSSRQLADSQRDGDLSYLGLPGSKTVFAKWMENFGWVALLLSAVLYFSGIQADTSLVRALGYVGGVCVSLIYLFQVYAWILVAAAVLNLYWGGSTPEGFKVSAIPIQAYLIAIVLIAIGYGLKKLLSVD